MGTPHKQSIVRIVKPEKPSRPRYGPNKFGYSITVGIIRYGYGENPGYMRDSTPEFPAARMTVENLTDFGQENRCTCITAEHYDYGRGRPRPGTTRAGCRFHNSTWSPQHRYL